MPRGQGPAEGAAGAAGEEEDHLLKGVASGLLSWIRPGTPSAKPALSSLTTCLFFVLAVQVLLRCLALLQRLLQEHRLKTQSELHRINAQYLEIKCSALILKLR